MISRVSRGELLPVDQRGELGHRCPLLHLPVLGEGMQPHLFDPDGVEDGGRDLGIRSGGDEEADVAGPAGRKEVLGASGRVGPYDDVPVDQLGIVTDMVSTSDVGGQLDDGTVEHGDVIGHGVGAGVPRAQQGGQRLTGAIREAEQRMEAEAALEGRGCLLLVLRVDLDQGGVDVQEDGISARRRRRSGPHLSSHLSHGFCDAGTGRRRDLVERASDRGVRRHRAEEVPSDAQVFDVETALATAGQHQCGLHEDLAPVVKREAASTPWDPGRQCITESQSVGKVTKSVQSDVGHHAGPTGFHHDATSAVTVHFGSALLFGDCWVSTTTVSPTGRAFPRTRRVQLK